MTNQIGTLKSFMSDLPRSIMISVVLICVLPITLNIFGIDFATPKVAFDVGVVAQMTGGQVTEAMFVSLKGSYVHTILEWSAFCVAIFTVILAFSHFHITGSVVTLIVGVALGFAGFMDAFHTLAADRLIDAVADNRQLIPFTWAICRLFNGLIILCVMGFLLFRKKVEEREETKKSIYIVGTISLLMATSAYFIIKYCATSQLLPKTMFPDATITRPWDIYPLVVFLISLFFVFPLFYRKYPSVFTAALIFSVLPDIAVQLHMAFGSTALFDNHFNIAHFLKIFSYLVPLLGLIVDYTRTYSSVTKSREWAENALIASEHATSKAIKASELANVSKATAEKALKDAVASRQEAEDTTEVMLGREEKIQELIKENERLRNKCGEE